MMRLGYGAVFVLRCLILLPGIHGAVLNLYIAWRQSSSFNITDEGAYPYLAALWATISSASLLIFADDSIVSRRSNDPNTIRTRRPLASLLACCLWYMFSIYRIYSGVYSPLAGWISATIGPSIGNFGRRYYQFGREIEVLPSKESNPFPKQSRWKNAFLRKEMFAIMSAALVTISLLLHKYAEQGLLSKGHRVHSAALGRGMPPFPHPSKSLVNPIRVLVLITSSWMAQSYNHRNVVRQTSLRLLPPSSEHLVVEYRFVLGSAPSSSGDFRTQQEIDEELSKHQDLLIVPVGDDYHNLTRRVYSSMAWADQYTFDYLIKTDNDVFVRWDVLAGEILEQGRKTKYWRGLSFWNMPQASDGNKPDHDSSLATSPLPQFTSGALYILSRDLTRVITSPSKTRSFTYREDQSIGVWLAEVGVTAIHDRRINPGAHSCKNDMIAKYFSHDMVSATDGGMEMMYKNIKSGRALCESFAADICPYCYACWKPTESMPASCNKNKGLVFLHGSKLPVEAVEIPETSQVTSEVKGSTEKASWLVPNIISANGSPLSNSSNWNHLYWLIWMSKADGFQERHYSAIDLILINDPRAVVTVVSSALPSDFFAAYTTQGYAVHVVPVSKDLIKERDWYTGPNTKAWISQWDTWEHDSPYFSDHLADYLRYVLIYRYGGTYLNFDTLWLRSPYPELEFVGSDYSPSEMEQDWKLNPENGLYMNNGIMRCQSGSDVFQAIAESAFDTKTYLPGCLNCVGPRATTSYIKANQHDLELRGLALLAPEVHYPYAAREIQEIFQAKPGDDSIDRSLAALRTVYQYSWSLHLFGQTTNRLEITSNSTVGILLDYMRLDIPHSRGTSHIGAPLPDHTFPPAEKLSLQAPESYMYSNSSQMKAASLLVPTVMTLSEQLQMSDRQLTNLGPSLDGTWEGLERVFIRGGPEMVSSATISIKLRCRGQHHDDESIGEVNVEMPKKDNSEDKSWNSELSISLGGSKGDARPVNKKDINEVLSSLRYRPSQHIAPRTTTLGDSGEELVITIVYGDESPLQKIITIVLDQSEQRDGGK